MIIQNGTVEIFGLSLDKFITILISLLNIILTVILTFVNYNNLRIKEKKSLKREAFINYYIPIKINLSNIIICLEKINIVCPKFDIFSTNISDESIRKFKDELINTHYNEYLNNLKDINYCYFDKEIDNLIFEMNMHIKFAISYYRHERAYTNSKIFDEIPMPDYKKIANKIEYGLHMSNYKRIIICIKKMMNI